MIDRLRTENPIAAVYRGQADEMRRRAMAYQDENRRLRSLLEEALTNYDPESSEMWSISMWLEDVANEVDGATASTRKDAQ